MKIEYSYYRDYPCIIIKQTDFNTALKQPDEYELFEDAVSSFCNYHDVPIPFGNKETQLIKKKIEKNGNIFYVINRRYLGRRIADEWCEVYVQNGARIENIVISDDYGRTYCLCGNLEDEDE